MDIRTIPAATYPLSLHTASHTFPHPSPTATPTAGARAASPAQILGAAMRYPHIPAPYDYSYLDSL
jgi:PAB1-binding protein PBP1